MVAALSRTELERLAALRSEQGTLSAYVGIDPQLMYAAGQAMAKFKGALKRFAQRTQEERWLRAAEREKERVLGFLERWRPSGRGLAIFSSLPADIWEVVPLAVPVPTIVSVGQSTNTALLAQVLDEYPRFVVALVQRDRGSIYVAEQRGAEEAAAVRSEVPGRHDQGGWAQARFQRHIEFHVEQHLRKLAQELERMYYDRPFNRLAVGGTQEVVAELQAMLSPPLSRRVIGTFPVDFKHEREDETLDRARELLRDEERRSEREIVEQVVNASNAGGHGVVGVEETVRAALEGRVHKLLVAEGVSAEGFACADCDYFAVREFSQCPACGGRAERSPDIIERTVERACLSGVEVDTVFADAREWLMANGGVAAVLRY